MTANEFTEAEIAGGIFKTAETCPVKGQLIRDFDLTSTEGRKVSVSDYQGRSNLVLVFAGESSRSLEFLAGIAKRYSKIQEEQAEVLAVLQRTPERATRVKDETHAAFPLLVDSEGRIHRLMGALDASGLPAMAIYPSPIALVKCLPCFGSRKSRRCLASKRFWDGSPLSTASVRNAARRSGLCDRFLQELSVPTLAGKGE